VSVVKVEEINKEEEIGIEQGSKAVLRSIIEEPNGRLRTRTNTSRRNETLICICTVTLKLKVSEVFVVAAVVLI
jgi:hypothetical protein